MLVPKGRSYCDHHDPGSWSGRASFQDRYGMSVARWRRLTGRVKRRDGFRCVRCGREAGEDTRLSVDHIIPVSRGGSNELTNLQTLCTVCHQVKTAQDRRMP